MIQKLIILIDFGSTYTKVVLMDLESEEIVSIARVPSTIDIDITKGLDEALKIISKKAQLNNIKDIKMLACSSAAGGLRMVCVGFVPEYTSEAAKYAALGAGAKVIGQFSYELNNNEIKEIEELSPDIILLTGGTNGGDRKVITHNARMLSTSNGKVKNILIAGNKSAYNDIKDIFQNSDKEVIFTENVMPEIGKLDLEPCNRKIRELFLSNIIEAKGIAKARTIVSDIIMPTPSAVLEAAKLIALGFDEIEGFGELIIVDVGGATTDVYSVAKGYPKNSNYIIYGLPEPFVKRTVEGDLGLKYNVDTLLKLLAGDNIDPRTREIAKLFSEGKIPETEEEINLHITLAGTAVKYGINRHAGKIEKFYGPVGEMFIQKGKDLTDVNITIGTGGPIVFSKSPRKVLENALYSMESPNILKPKNLQFFIDEQYIIFAIGLLSQVEPEKAIKIVKKYLKKV